MDSAASFLTLVINNGLDTCGNGVVSSSVVVMREPSLTMRRGMPTPVEGSRPKALSMRLSWSSRMSSIDMLFKHAVSVAEQGRMLLK